MKITVLCVGKIKENFYSDAVAEYIKRLSRYAKVSITEVADEKTPDGASPREEDRIRAAEGARLLDRWADGAYTFALAINGGSLSSEQFAARLDSLAVSGVSHVQFVIGGSLGLAPEVLARANERLSFSKMTFPHQLMRVILLEQVYRAFRIIRNEPYHK